MNRIDELLAQLCPEGVEFRELGDVAEVRSGWGFPNAYQGQTSGKYPFYKVSDMNLRGNEFLMTYANNYIEVDSVRKLGITPAPPGTVIFPKIGAAVATNKKRLLAVESAYDNNVMGLIPTKQMEPRFLLYWMHTFDLVGISNDSGAVPSIRKSEMENVRIPIPPLAVQREIVKVLDAFTALEAELEAELAAELAARRRQYQHYRDALLSFGELRSENGEWRIGAAGDEVAQARRGEVRWATLGEIAINLDSQRRPVTKSAREAGEFPYYGASGIVDYVSEYIFDGDYLLVSEDGANLLARSTPIAFSISGKTWVNNHAHVLQFASYAERRFIEMYLNSIDLSPYVSGAAQPKLNQTNLNRILVPIPPLAEQARIVAVLDQFDALMNDLSRGLPAEIAARRQQYAHYRDRLLTFREAV